MKEKRATILMAVLLVVLAGYLYRSHLQHALVGSSTSAGNAPPPLAGVNRIEALTVSRDRNGLYFADVKYFYRGDGHFAAIGVQSTAAVGADQQRSAATNSKQLQRGEHTVHVEVPRPFDGNAVLTRQVVARLWTDGGKPKPLSVDYIIQWPDYQTYQQQRQLAVQTDAQILQQAIQLIDDGSDQSLELARKKVEAILLRSPDYVAAYPEMARIAMKTNWGPEGLRQAEGYLKSGLAIDPNNSNVKILLAYVYAHQKHYQKSDAMMTALAKTGTKNLWLWTNWGELMSMQGKTDQALEKYMHAIDTPRGYDTYDRAIVAAYRSAFPILREKKQFNELDALYRKRAADFPEQPRYFADYGQYRLVQFGDYQAGIKDAKEAIDKGCDCDEAKYTLGMSYYVAWTKLQGRDRADAFNRATVFLPDGPRMLYEMARFDETARVIPQLLRHGSSLHARDNSQFNALAYALLANDVDAARRLAKYGARFDEPVGERKFPVGLIPIYKQNVDEVRMMKAIGVNFAQIRFQGVSAVDYARKFNNKDILDLVDKTAKYPL